LFCKAIVGGIALDNNHTSAVTEEPFYCTTTAAAGHTATAAAGHIANAAAGHTITTRTSAIT
jgi:hypothetical protein